MAGVSKFSITYQTKSISFSCRSHPITFEIEEQLNKIKSTASKATNADAICNGLSQLTILYKCLDGLLTSSNTKILMSHVENTRLVDHFSDESVKFLDICVGLSEMLLETEGHIKDLLCSLRRRNRELSVEKSIMKYNCFRKKMKKDVRRLIGSLKLLNSMIIGVGSGGSVVVDSDNHQLVAVIRAIIGVSEMTIMVFESLLMFLCVPVSKPNRWSFVVSKLIHKGACEDQQKNRIGNEFERIDAALRILCKYGFSGEMRNVKIAQCTLERLGVKIKSIEGGLDCIFRCLVRTRVSFLNIISQ